MIEPATEPLLILAAPLTRAAFAPFGDVVALDDEAAGRAINQGTSQRYDGILRLDLGRSGGSPRASIVRAAPADLPVALRLMERHPLGSQLFLPLGTARFLVVVADRRQPPGPEDLSAFLTDGRQGVNYRRGIWHHPLIALDRTTDFLVVDRSPEADNYEEAALDPGYPVLVTLR